MYGLGGYEGFDDFGLGGKNFGDAGFGGGFGGGDGGRRENIAMAREFLLKKNRREHNCLCMYCMYEMSYTETECIKIRTKSQDTNMHVNSCLYECLKVIYVHVYICCRNGKHRAGEPCRNFCRADDKSCSFE